MTAYTAEPEVVVGPGAILGEAPRWFDERLWWVDIAARAVHRFDPRDGTDVHDLLDDAVTFVLPRRKGGVVLGLGHAVAVRSRSGSQTVVAELGTRDVRCNDASCDREGNLYVGTMARDGTGRHGRLVQISPDGAVTTLVSEVGIANGIGFDPERRRAYFVDSVEGRVDAIDLARGWERGRTAFAAVPSGHGLPDGLTVDGRGFVWVAVYGGGQLRRYSPEGEIDMIVPVPASQTTSCTFGGPALTDLYITTAAEPRPDDDAPAVEPLAGALFRLRSVGRGRPVDPFAG